MASKHPPKKPRAPQDRPTTGNEGEGNKTADRNYREATTEFVQSDRGKREIENAGNVSPEQEKDIRRAEEQAKQRAKDHDPAEKTGGQDPTVRSSRPKH